MCNASVLVPTQSDRAACSLSIDEGHGAVNIVSMSAPYGLLNDWHCPDGFINSGQGHVAQLSQLKRTLRDVLRLHRGITNDLVVQLLVNGIHVPHPLSWPLLINEGRSPHASKEQ
mmetsp:Transcript_12221/g.22589  ORF Transcript_12221/g.22589 Transcript_12221/m.22589 type:complete len:115 (+) Transcript_12221:34-378(+)